MPTLLNAFTPPLQAVRLSFAGQLSYARLPVIQSDSYFPASPTVRQTQ